MIYYAIYIIDTNYNGLTIVKLNPNRNLPLLYEQLWLSG